MERAGFVPHVARPLHLARSPVHVTMKRVALAPSLRAERVFRAILREIAFVVARGVRIVEYSIQDDHVHLLVEAEDARELGRGMQLLFSRMAFAVNRVARRSGKLFRDRHHRVPLTSPTQTRNTLRYVLLNERKHDARRAVTTEEAYELLLARLDPCASGHWFDRWDARARPPPEIIASRLRSLGPSPLAPPRTWLLKTGWMRANGGALRFDEVPVPTRARPRKGNVLA